MVALKADITIDRPPQIVWDFFTDPENWQQWHGGALKRVDPKWQKGAALVWALGGQSTVLNVIPQETIEIEHTWTAHTWSFVDKDENSTLLVVQERFDKGAMVASAEVWMTDMTAKLSKFKQLVESRPQAEVAESTASEGGASKGDPLKCPHCGEELQGAALASIKAALAMGEEMVDFANPCPSCGGIMYMKHFVPTWKPYPYKKWWQFWK